MSITDISEMRRKKIEEQERARANRHKWYVIQIIAGQEEQSLKLVKSIINKNDYLNCFYPRYLRPVRNAGRWVTEALLMFPGYLFIDTKKIDEISKQLEEVPAFTKLLGNSEHFLPLTTDEEKFMLQLTERGEKPGLLRCSEGYIDENDQVVLTEGPLRAVEGRITKIDRHKRMAYVEIEMCGRMVEMKAGLEIVERRRRF